MQVDNSSSEGSPPWGLSALLIAAAVLLALPSLLYPYGYDHAIYAYVGGGWWHGLLPYVDSIDHKPPAAFAAAALAEGLGGWTGWIRLLDLLAVALGAAAVSSLLDPGRGGRLRVFSLCLLLASAFYFTLFSYWSTAQVESLQGACLALAWALARARVSPQARAWGVGLLLGHAAMYKFTVLLPGLIPAAVLLSQVGAGGRAAVAHAAARMLGGGLVAVGAWTLPLVLGGAGPAMWELVIEFNREYADRGGFDLDGHVAFWGRDAALFSVIGLGGWLVRGVLTRRERPPGWADAALAGVMLLLIEVVVGVQGKYNDYHRALATPFAVLAAAYGLLGLARVRRWLPQVAAVALAGVLFVLPPRWEGAISYRTWWTQSVAAQVSGGDRGALLELFDPGGAQGPAFEARIGALIRQRAQPGDTLWVEVPIPGIYHTAGLRAPTRLFNPGVMGLTRFKGGAFMREAAGQLMSSPPRFLVSPNTPRRLAVWKAQGYEVLREEAHLTVLERR